MAEEEQSKPTPEHLSAQSAIAKGYKYYVNMLKRGARTGISGDFGSASDLLGGVDGPAKTHRMQAPDLQPKTELESGGRALYLSYLMLEFCRDYLNNLLSDCAKGLCGPGISEVVKNGAAQSNVSIAAKHLSAVSTYMIVFDLGPPDSVPLWIKDFLGGSIAACDYLMAEPPVNNIVTLYAPVMTSLDYTRSAVAQSVCNILGLTSAPSQSPVSDFLQQSQAFRLGLFNKALTEPFESLAAELKQKLGK